MLEQKEGSQAVADAIALCRPEVICAYPISPQTHIVEGLSDKVRTGELSPCEYVSVESEFAAMSVAIGAAAAGARPYTATASQGLLYMAEALYNASGLGLPIVMTVANRAIGSPINIWNDHSDSMSQRDSGWIQLYAESGQEALDLHIQAFKLAEQLSLPVMVCMDGFILTHAFERVDVPTQEQVDAFLPPFRPRQLLDPAEPVTIGALVGPEAFTEVKYLMHAKQMQALDRIPEIAGEFAAAFGRESGGLAQRLPHRGRGDRGPRARLGARNDPGRGGRASRPGREHRRPRAEDLPAIPARGGPGSAVRRQARGGAREGLRHRRGRHRRPERAPGHLRQRHPRVRRGGRSRRPADHQALTARVCSPTRSRTGSSRRRSSTWTGTS